MSKSKTVYGLVCPVDGLIRYVGITSQGLRSRLRYHWGCRNEHVCREWFQHLERRGLFPDAIPLKENASLEDESDQWGRLILEGHPVMNNFHKNHRYGRGIGVEPVLAYCQNDQEPIRSHSALPSATFSRKRWNRNNPQKRASYTAKWRKKYPLRYRDYQRRYMAARRALLKARRLEEEAGYGEV